MLELQKIQMTYALDATIGLLAVWLCYHFVWLRSLRTVFAQDLFRLRDRLFIEAASGKLSFESPGYGMLRSMLQSTIRSGTALTWIDLSLARMGSSFSLETPAIHQKLDNYIDSLGDCEEARILRTYRNELLKSIAYHIIRLYFVPILGAILLFLLVHIPLSSARRLADVLVSSRLPRATRFVDASFNRQQALVAA